jgi:transposase
MRGLYPEPEEPAMSASEVTLRDLYRYRNLVERFFNKLKHFRAVATRYDKLPENYLASVKLASIRIWMRFNESVT